MDLCSCEDHSSSTFGKVDNAERLMRVVTNRHFKNNGALKPSAFPITDVRERGLSLVRGDLIDHTEFEAVAADIVRLSGATEARGALVGAAHLLRGKLNDVGERLLCVKDDPVRNEEGVRDNEAHAITMASRPLADLDVQELRDWMLEAFRSAQNSSSLYP